MLLNKLVVYVSLPALTLVSIHSMELSSRAVVLVSMPWLLFALATALFWALARPLGLSHESRAALVLTVGLSNTSFLGFPMIRALLGPEALPTAILIDQLGSFLVLSTLGVATAGGFNWRRVVSFPPFIALVAAVVLRPFAFADWLDHGLHLIASTLTPLALAAVAVQVAKGGWRAQGRSREIALALSWKLVLAPAVMWLVYVQFLGPGIGMTPLEGKVLVLQAAMAPMITGALLAIEKEQDSRLATLVLTYGIVISFITVPAWTWLLGA